MFVFGERNECLSTTVNLIEAIVKSQLINLVILNFKYIVFQSTHIKCF